MSGADIRAALACGRSACECGRRSGKVHCPIHDAGKGGRPDLSITEAAGRPLVFCHVCGQAGQDAIIADLRARGIWSDADTARRSPRVETGRTAWEIRDDRGVVQAIHDRTDFSDGSKTFAWRRPDGRAGLGGRKAASLPLYGSELLADLAPGSTVVICEGEKAADAARRLGVVALATVTGAGNPMHADDVLRALIPFDAVLWPDNDDKGRAHMADLGRRLVALEAER